MLMAWLHSQAGAHGLLPETLRPASSDASFRRYFRLDTEPGGTFIAMDAPPDREDSRPFVKVARLFGAAGVIMVLPMLLLFLALQRRFIEGVSTSGLGG